MGVKDSTTVFWSLHDLKSKIIFLSTNLFAAIAFPSLALTVLTLFLAPLFVFVTSRSLSNPIASEPVAPYSKAILVLLPS